MSERSAGSRVGWAIVGCGRVADRRIAPAMGSADNARLVAFCSRSLDRASQFMERHGAELAFDDLEEMLHEPQVEAVYIATPNALHAEHAVACLEAGKHVLVDKPMATTVGDARRMVEAATGARRTLSVMFQMRYHPANQQLKEMIEESTVGSLCLVRAHLGFWFPPGEAWRHDADLAGGGAGMDLAPHAVDLLRFLAGDVVQVQAVTANVQFHYHVEDLALATLWFASGPLGRLDVSYCTHEYGGRIEVLGSEGSVVLDGSLQQIGGYRMWSRRGNTDQPAQIVEGQFAGCYVEAVEEFGDAIRQQRQPAITAADGLRNVEVIAALYESARTQRPVVLES